MINIRPILNEDTDAVLRWRNSDRVRKFFIFQDIITREMHQSWLDNKVKKGIVEQFIIEFDGHGIGSTYLSNIDYKHKNAELGIFVGESVYDKGIGTEAVMLLLKHGFNTLKLHKIYLRVLETNVRAIRCYEKCGFKKEAFLEDEACIQGEYKNIYRMAIINKGD